MNFHFTNDRPIYLQIAEQLECYIIAGHFPPGEKLPSVRDLALYAKVNPNTMQKALTELEQHQIITTERTNGKYVTSDQKFLAKLRDKHAELTTKDYLKAMSNLGFDKKSTLTFIKMKGK